MPDITMCAGNECPKKKECYRFRTKPTPDWQAYFANLPYNDELKKCDFFILYDEKNAMDDF